MMLNSLRSAHPISTQKLLAETHPHRQNSRIRALESCQIDEEVAVWTLLDQP